MPSAPAASPSSTRPGRPRPVRTVSGRPSNASPAPLSRRQGRAAVVLVSDRALGVDRLPVPSVLAVGAVHAALTEAGLRGRTDIAVEAADVLDPHSLAMVLAAGARVVHPWLAIRVAAEAAGSRGAEELTEEAAVGNLLDGFEAGLRKTLARMGISAVASYVGGALFETLDLAPEVTTRCFPAAPGWEGGSTSKISPDASWRARDGARPGCPGGPCGRGRGPGPRAAPARPRFRPLPRRWRAPRLRAADRQRHPGPGQQRGADARLARIPCRPIERRWSGRSRQSSATVSRSAPRHADGRSLSTSWSRPDPSPGASWSAP